MSSWAEFQKDPFGFVDRINLTYKGYDFNILHDDAGVRKVARNFGIVCLALWVILGFDSTPLQFVHIIQDGLPGLILGQKSLGDLVAIYNAFYGKEMHYSAFVIYFLLFYFMSKNWSRVGIVKTKNVVYSFGAMFISIAVFEWFWIFSFGVFQNQPWVYTWQMPQLRILLQNTMFLIAGAFCLLYIYVDSFILENKMIIGRNFTFCFRSWKLWILVVAGVAAALLWVYYPWHVHQISVTLDNGQVWHSSRLFPQTLYTVDLDPSDGVNAGVWFYVENNWIHGLNTTVKAIWAAVTYYVFKVKKA